MAQDSQFTPHPSQPEPPHPNGVVPAPAEPSAVRPQPQTTVPPQPTVSQPKVSSNKPSRSDGIKSILSTLLILISAPIMAWAIVNYVFQSYEVDGPSMSTTLHDHDRLIIWKLPHTWSRITNKTYQPNRGDIIVFVKKGLYDFDANKEKQLVKRVIGLPGERVVVKDGKMTIYNAQHPEGFEPDSVIKYDHQLPTTLGDVDLTVPAGEVFAVGDNRINSLDSRYFGTVPDDDIVGKLVARILPVNQAEWF